MTTLLLVRHAAHALQDRAVLVGRTADVGLGETGRATLPGLVGRLATKPADAVLSGPLERAIATATPIAARLGLALQVAPELDELDYGEWTGRSFDDLAHDSRWAAWNAYRSGHRPPGGESMLEVQARVVGLVERLRRLHPDGRVVLVSHADVIRALVLHALGLPLDLFLRIEVEPGSISVLQVEDWGARLLRLNDTGANP